MAISATLSGNQTSDTSVAANDNSVVHISGVFDGGVRLQMAPTGTTNWLDVVSVNYQTTTPVLTPDNTMIYRFIVNLKSGVANVYFGA